MLAVHDQSNMLMECKPVVRRVCMDKCLSECCVVAWTGIGIELTECRIIQVMG